MVNLVGKVPPLEASGAEVTLVHPTATTVVGQWDVTYPQDMPEEQRPDLGPTRTFGYAHRLVKQPPRFARRHVRRDIQIDARDKNGWSDAESQIDSAARELSGDVVFQRTLTDDELGALVPNVDFAQGDVLPLLVWGMVVPATCTSIRYSLQDGVRTAEVGFGPSLLSDTTDLAESMRQIDRQMRAEAAGIDEQLASQLDEAKSHANTVVAVEREERQADVAQVREVLGGAQADEGDLLSQLTAVQSQITGMVDDGEAPPPPGLLNSYLWMNTQLWEAQREIDEAQDQLAEQQTARQDEQDAIMDAMQAQLGRMGDRSWQVGTDGDGVWRVDGSTVQALGSWVGTAVLDVTRRTRSGNTDVTVIAYPREVRRVEVGTTRSWNMTSDVHAAVFYYQRADGSLTRLDQRLPRFVAGTWWTPVRTVTVEKDRLISMELRVDWAAANRGSLYGVRITVDGQTVAEDSSTSVGPLSLLGSGARSQSVSRNIDVKAGQTVRFEARCNHSGEAQRTASGGNTRLWWMEN